MDYLEQIQCGVDYIETRLDQPIVIDAVAREACMSRWHFQRMFKGLSGDTVKHYIRSRRLALALETLLHSDTRIIDVALAAGFDSQESFTRAFKAAFATTPAEYRRAGKKLPAPSKPSFDLQYLQHLHQGIAMAPEIYEQKAMLCIGMRTTFFGSDSEKNNIADKLPPLWQQFLARLPEIENRIAGTCYGIVRQLRESSDELEYYCVAEISSPSKIPAGMLELRQAAATYARFQHRGKPQLIDNTVNYIYTSWLAQSDYRHSGGADLEFYGANYSADSSESVMHYAIPIISN
jgi:AraC family transcriptional regulator